MKRKTVKKENNDECNSDDDNDGKNDLEQTFFMLPDLNGYACP